MYKSPRFTLVIQTKELVSKDISPLKPMYPLGQIEYPGETRLFLTNRQRRVQSWSDGPRIFGGSLSITCKKSSFILRNEGRNLGRGRM